MSPEKKRNYSSKLPEGGNNLVSLTSVLEIINRSSLLSVQKTALSEALGKALQGNPLIPSQIETQQIPLGKENEPSLLARLEKVLKIDTDPDVPDNKEGNAEDRVNRVVETAEAYRKLATGLADLIEEDDPDDLGLPDLKRVDDLIESAKETLEEKSNQNPDLELIVITVLESLGINFHNLLPFEKRMILDDLERQGIAGPEL